MSTIILKVNHQNVMIKGYTYHHDTVKIAICKICKMVCTLK